MKVVDKKEKSRHTIRLQTFDSIYVIFSAFYLPGNMLLSKVMSTHTHTHTQTYTQQDTMVMIIGKICKEDLPKNLMRDLIMQVRIVGRRNRWRDKRTDELMNERMHGHTVTNSRWKKNEPGEARRTRQENEPGETMRTRHENEPGERTRRNQENQAGERTDVQTDGGTNGLAYNRTLEQAGRRTDERMDEWTNGEIE